jgi:hypothetical protein
MGKCSSCGRDLPGEETLCHDCYLVQYAALADPKVNAGYGSSAYTHLLLWILIAYAFLTYTPEPAKAAVLGLGLAVESYLFFWALSQRPPKNYSTPPDRLSFILGVCLGLAWKITGVDLWERLGVACILVSAGYTAVYIAVDRTKTTTR